MRGTDLIFECDHLLHYKCHKINFKRGVSYIDSPDWTKSKKTTIKPITKKMFSAPCTVTLNHKVIKKDSERITKAKPFINKYKWDGINYLSEKDDWKKLEKNQAKKIHPAYVSKHNLNREKYVILLMIPNREKLYYLAIKNYQNY